MHADLVVIPSQSVQLHALPDHGICNEPYGFSPQFLIWNRDAVVMLLGIAALSLAAATAGTIMIVPSMLWIVGCSFLCVHPLSLFCCEICEHFILI